MAGKTSKLPGAGKVSKATEVDPEAEKAVVEDDAAAEVDLSHYDAATRKKARALIAAGKVVNGTEEADLINTMFEALQEEEREEITEAEEVDGVPNKLPVRTEDFTQGGKVVKLPVFFVAAVKGGKALFNERGQRVSPVCTAESDPSERYIAKAAARFNAQRRANRLPTDAVA